MKSINFTPQQTEKWVKNEEKLDLCPELENMRGKKTEKVENFALY